MKRLKFRNERVGFVVTVAIGMTISILLDPVPFKFRLGLFAVVALVLLVRRARGRLEPGSDTENAGGDVRDETTVG
jgi:membrane protein implicated in regulation of membrane protease activity